MVGPAEKLAVLTRAAALLSSSTDFASMLGQTISACLPSLGDFGFFDLRIEGDEVVRTARAHEAPDIEAILRPTSWVASDRRDINLCALSTGEPGLHPEIGDAWYQDIAAGPGHLAILRTLAFRSMLTVPLRYGTEVIGALTLFYGRSGRRYTADHLQFAQELAAMVAPVVVNARLLERQRRAEEALRVSEQRLRLAIDAGGLGIWEWNVSTNAVVWSDGAHDHHGLERGAFGGRFEDFVNLVHADDRARVLQAITDAVETSTTYSIEYRVPVRTGMRWIAGRADVIRDADGRALGMIGASFDITERVALLEAERSGRERLELLARAGELLTNSLDRDATLEAIIKTIAPPIADWCRIDLLDDRGELCLAMSYHADSELARRASVLARDYQSPATVVGSLAWVAKHGKPYTTLVDAEQVAHLPPGALRDFVIETRVRSTLCVPLIARGRTLGVLTAVRDDQRPQQFGAGDISLFTELAGRAALALDNARLYAEAGRARTDAETANRTKDEFLAILGHELRNPLAPIVSALYLMERRSPEIHQRERDIISRQVAHLSHLLGDLLDVSRIVRGKVEIARERVDLRDVVEKAIEMTRPLLTQREQRIDLELGSASAWVHGDPQRLGQVVGNLLSNAAKFSPKAARVTIQIRREDGMHVLRVRDEGIGIAPDLLPKLFELFVQGEQPLDRGHGGLGLGLAIVANLVEAHGGTATAESEGTGHGSTFTVRLPEAVASSALAPAPPAPTPGGGGRRVLLVDDNTDAAILLADVLRDEGYIVFTETDPHAALDRCAQLAPDLAILDIGLPGMDGYALAVRLHATRGLERLPLVALTGYGRPADRTKAEAAGFRRHLAKPVNVDTLLATLAELLSK